MAGPALQKVGRYEIVGELGKGAMGVVYKATDPNIGRTVALKTMRLDVHGLDADEMLQRFRNEARLAGVLNHPNIVTIYDAGEADGMFFIAMECIEGQTLHHWMQQKRVLPTEQVIHIAQQTCAGLDAAHGHNVIHRDIKPANLMIEPDGTVKIMDFGIAKSGGGMTSTGQVLGTPNYMSPEQVKGKQLDGRSDLFSFGVILYEMVTGEKPFSGQNVTTIIYKIVNEHPIPPRQLDARIHPGLSAVVEKALYKQPEERYQKGADLVRDLQNYKKMAPPPPPGAVQAGGFYSADLTNTQTMSGTAMGKTTTGPRPAVSTTKSGAAAAPAARPHPLSATASHPQKPAERVFEGDLDFPSKKRALPGPPWMIPTLVGVVLLIVGVAIYQQYRSSSQQAETQRQIQEETAMRQAVAQAVEASKSTQPSEASRATKPPKQTGGASATSTTKAAAKGEMVLSSNPDGARVQIDGRSDPGWVTPFNATSLVPGPHTVEFSKMGYANETRMVEVQPSKKAFVSAQLTAVAASVTLNSDPAGAAIILDGHETGRQTPAQLSLAAGNHNLTLRKEGYRDASTVASLREGQPFSFAPTLAATGAVTQKPMGRLGKIFGEADKGVIEVRTRPRDAQLSLDGKPVGKNTPARFPAEAGRHELLLQLEGYKPLRKTLTVEKGMVLKVEEELQPK